MSVDSIPDNIRNTLDVCRRALLASSSSNNNDNNDTSNSIPPYQQIVQQVDVAMKELDQLRDEMLRLQQQQQQQQQQPPPTTNSLNSFLGSSQHQHQQQQPTTGGTLTDGTGSGGATTNATNSHQLGSMSGAISSSVVNNNNTSAALTVIRRRDRKATVVDRRTGTAGSGGKLVHRKSPLIHNGSFFGNISQRQSRSGSAVLGGTVGGGGGGSGTNSPPQNLAGSTTNFSGGASSFHNNNQNNVSTSSHPNLDAFKNIPVDGISGGLSITIGRGSDHHNEDAEQENLEDTAVADDDVADWLNNQFADAEERDADAGFDIPVLQRRQSSSDENVLSDNDGEKRATSVSTARPVEQQQQQAKAEQEKQKQNEAVSKPAKQQKEGVLESADAERSANISYQRTHQRKTDARIPNSKVEKILARHDIKFVPEVHSPDFDIFSLYNEYRSSTATSGQATARTFLAVCASVMCSYSFPFNLDFDLPKLFNFIREAEKLYAKNNPYHNAVHAADVLQSTHIYLCTGDVNNYFSDTELFAVLFAAMVHDLGHLGANNAFLQSIHHPTAILYNDACIQEAFHTSLAFMMLKNVQLNNENNNNNNNTHNNNVAGGDIKKSATTAPAKTDFLTGSHVWTEALYKDFRSTVIDIIWGTDMKNHATLMQSAAGILEDNIIEDSEVPALLRSIVHAADLSNPLKPWEVYVEHAVRVVAEFWRQGDEEARRGLKISPMCDRNATHFAKAQKGFIDFVVRPWMKTLEPVLPKIWLERMEANCAQVAAMTQEEVDQIHLRIAHHASTPFDDGVMSSVYSMLKKCVSPNMELFGSLKTKNPVGKNQQDNNSTDEVKESPAAVLVDLSPSDVAARLRAQWSDIIKGLTSRGSLSQTSAVVTWANSLAEANRRVEFLTIPDSMIQSLRDARDLDNNNSTEEENKFVSRHLSSNSAEEARSVLSKLGAADFKDPFSFVRTLNLTVLDMTRPVGSPPRVSVVMNRNSNNNNNTSSSSSTPIRSNSDNNQQQQQQYYSIQKNTGVPMSNNNNNNVTPATAYYQRQMTSFASPQQQQQQQPSTTNNFVLSGADFNPRKNEVVRFFSEERPVVVPLETRMNGGGQ